MGRGKDIVRFAKTRPLLLSLFSSRYVHHGGEDPSCLSWEDFDKLRSGEEEESLEVGLKSWCIVKLDGVRPAGRSTTCACSLES